MNFFAALVFICDLNSSGGFGLPPNQIEVHASANAWPSVTRITWVLNGNSVEMKTAPLMDETHHDGFVVDRDNCRLQTSQLDPNGYQAAMGCPVAHALIKSVDINLTVAAGGGGIYHRFYQMHDGSRRESATKLVNCKLRVARGAPLEWLK